MQLAIARGLPRKTGQGRAIAHRGRVGSGPRAGASKESAVPWGDTLDAWRARISFRTPSSKSERGTAPVGSYPTERVGDLRPGGQRLGVGRPTGTPRPTSLQPVDYINPQGLKTGIMRIVRGGAWVNADARYLRRAVPPQSSAGRATPTASGSAFRVFAESKARLQLATAARLRCQ